MVIQLAFPDRFKLEQTLSDDKSVTFWHLCLWPIRSGFWCTKCNTTILSLWQIGGKRSYNSPGELLQNQPFGEKPRIPQDISGFPHKPQFVENVTKWKLFISALNVFTGFVMRSNFFYHPNFHLFNIHIFVFKKIPQICTDRNCERYLDNDLWMISLSTSILHLRQFIEGYCWIYGPSGSKKRESGDQLGLHGNLQIY